jgi:hypothetical protein
MVGPRARQLANELWLGGIEAAQQFVQRAKNLVGERGGDCGLGVPAFLQQRGQAAIRGVGKQAEGVEQELEPAQHGPTGHRAEFSQRKRQVTRGLAARGIDQPQLRRVSILAVLRLFLFRDEQPSEDAGFAQQPLESLMRRRLPSVSGTSRIRIDARGLHADQELPTLIARLQFPDSPGRAQRRVVLRELDVEIVRQIRPARAAINVFRLPAKHLREKGPRFSQGRFGGIRIYVFGNDRGVSLRLPRGCETKLFQHDRCHDQTDRLNVVEPFEIGIAFEISHAAHPEAGQR